MNSPDLARVDRASPPEASAPAPAGGLSLGTIADKLLFFPLVYLYVVLVHFGSLVRFSSEETSRGISTLVGLALIALGGTRILRAFGTEKLVFWTLGALLVYLAMFAAVGPDPLKALRGAPVELTGYILLAAALSRTGFSRSQLKTLWLWMAGALFVSAFLTIIDYVGVFDVPYNNDAVTETRAAGLDVWQASGFFARRSGMAAIFAISITGSLVLAFAHESARIRLYFLTAAAFGLLCLFLTHNRSGVLSPILVAGIYALISPRFRGGRRIRILLGASAAAAVLLAVVVAFFPNHLAVYVAKLGFIGLADTTWSSDKDRIDLFLVAVASIAESPLGNGFTRIPLPGGALSNAHNVITAIIWAVGIFSLIWLPVFTFALFVAFSGRLGARLGPAPLSVESDAVSCALLAWLLNGMTHNIMFTGLAWVLFGVALSIRHFRSSAAASPGVRPGVATAASAGGP